MQNENKTKLRFAQIARCECTLFITLHIGIITTETSIDEKKTTMEQHTAQKHANSRSDSQPRHIKTEIKTKTTMIIN